MRLGAMITARFDSERYPGKVVAKIMGKPILAHLIEQLKELLFVDEIIVCTSNLIHDDPLEEIANEYQVGLTRGHPDILIERHMQCIRGFDLDAVLDICGDAPFFDRRITQRVIDYYRTVKEYDVYGITPPRDLAGYVWQVTIKMRAWYEYFEEYYYNSPGKYRQLNASQYWWLPMALEGKEHPFATKEIPIMDLVDLQQSLFKNTVDYPIELAWINLICEHLGHRPETLEDWFQCFKEIKAVKEV